MNETLRLDRIDFRILSILERSGRISNIDLAHQVGLSPSPCLVRVRRMEQAGVIAGYGARTDLDRLGDVLTVFAEVTLTGHRAAALDRFEARVREIAEIVECHLISGGYDYLLKFVTRGVDHYQQLVDELVDSDCGVEKVNSYVVIRSPIAARAAPLASLFRGEKA